MPDFEMCIHRDDRASGVLEYLQSARMNGRESSAGEVIDSDHLLSAFVFPILDLTKTQMLYWARVHGVDDLMELTCVAIVPLDPASHAAFAIVVDGRKMRDWRIDYRWQRGFALG
jgi:hypothetical protein